MPSSDQLRPPTIQLGLLECWMENLLTSEGQTLHPQMIPPCHFLHLFLLQSPSPRPQVTQLLCPQALTLREGEFKIWSPFSSPGCLMTNKPFPCKPWHLRVWRAARWANECSLVTLIHPKKTFISFFTHIFLYNPRSDHVENRIVILGQ